MRKRLFIGSSVAGLDAAYAAQENLEHDFEVTAWSQGIFDLSQTNIENLYAALNRFDAAVFVFRADDKLEIAGTAHDAVRDNVLFELGLFIGRLGRSNTFILKPRASAILRLPTDLLGVTPAEYDDQRADGNLVAALGPACNKIRRALNGNANALVRRTNGQDLSAILISRPFRLFFNPPSRSKIMRFADGGGIMEGNNKNEHSWRITGGKLELVQLDGKVHSRFRYVPEEGLFRHTNDPDTPSLRDQYLAPED